MSLPADRLPLIRLEGTPEEMGAQHAAQAGRLIQEGVAPRMALCREFPSAQGVPRSEAAIRELASACLAAHEAFCPDLLRELWATAQAAQIEPLELLIYNGFTDFKDLLYADGTEGVGGCTAFAVPPKRTRDGFTLLGQTWDMYSSALPAVCLLSLHPKNLPSALMVSLAGCVGMFGINSTGLAVCTNNLHARAGRPGVFWPFLMRRILACSEFAEAAALLDQVQLAGGHNFLLAGPKGEVGEWEIMPYARASRPGEEILLHTNHCLHATTQKTERVDGEIGRASSEERLRQARTFCQEVQARRKDGWTLADLAALTRYQSATSPHSICMQPLEGYPVETCAAALLRPQTGEM